MGQGHISQYDIKITLISKLCSNLMASLLRQLSSQRADLMPKETEFHSEHGLFFVSKASLQSA